MQSWSLRSAERQESDDAMMRRFVEASRRAEIIALVNSAATLEELGETVTAELCEAFEAEAAFLLATRAAGNPPELVGSTGLTQQQGERLLHDPACVGSFEASEPVARDGNDLLGIGGRTMALAPAGASGDRVLVGVTRLYDQPFDPPELALLEAVTKSATVALQRSWLSVERERHAAQQAAIARAARALGESLDPGQVLTTLCREVAYATTGDVVLVYFGDEDAGLTAVAAHGVPDELIGLRRAPGEGLSGRVLATGAPQVSNDYQRDGLAPDSTSALHDVRSAMSAPLHRGGGLDGAISVGFVDGRWMTDEDLKLLSAFAELASVACRNADEHAAAMLAASHDALTGCLNHAAFQGRLREEISRSERGAEPFSLVLLDLEDFKEVNERFGHLSGDTVLRTVGELLRLGVREYDHVARFGGDEFALILPETNEAEAAALVGRLVEALDDIATPGEVRLGAHSGLAEWMPGEPPTALIERADQALRKAKRAVAPGEGDARRVERALDADAAAVHQRRAEQRRRRLAVAARVGAKLSRILELESIADATVRELTDTLGFEYAGLLRLSGDGYVTGMAFSGAPSTAQPDSSAQSQDQGAIGRCLRERRPVLVGDASRDPAYSGRLCPGMRSELALPVHAGTELWGVLDLQSSEVSAFGEDDARLVELVADHAGAALRTSELYRKLEQTHLGVAEALAAALEAKDGYTANHAAVIADLAVDVGRQLELPEPVLRDVRYGAIFHDIGKIAIPDAILNKPGPLTDEEFTVIKTHPVMGEQILAPVPFLAAVRRIVRHDHERWDGTGYPDGLRGPQIPVGARIVLVVDAYHAMVSDRPYRKAMDPERAKDELRAHAGSQFDPRVVEAFLTVVERR